MSTFSTRPASIRELMQEYRRMHKDTKVAAAYLRNSDSGKKDEEEFQVQLDAIRKYCAETGYELPDHLIFRDAKSSTKYPYWDREGLMDLLDAADDGLFEVAVATEFWRFARDGDEQAAIDQYLKRHNATTESVTEKYDDTLAGKLLRAIDQHLGKLEAQKIKLRTARGKRYRAERALTGQGYPTYGYAWVDGEKYAKERYEFNLTIIYTDENGKNWTEVDVVVFIYDSCLQGMSTRRIALTLTQMGISTQRGREVWNSTTVRQILTNINYTGNAYNWRWSRVGKKSSVRLPKEGELKLPQGIFPKIIEPEVFEQVSQQLKYNAEMSPRNNKHPEIGIMRGHVYCGICQCKMHIQNHCKPNGNHHNVQRSEYECKKNEGVNELKRRHAVSRSIHLLDPAAWAFTISYLANQELLNAQYELMREGFTVRDHTAGLEEEISALDKSIRSIYKLGEITDPDDENAILELQQTLLTLQLKKRDKQRLLNRATNKTEREQKFLEAIDKFDVWVQDFRFVMENPEYNPDVAEMRDAVKFLGVRATVWPETPDYPERVRFNLRPPSLEEFYAHDFTNSSSQFNLSHQAKGALNEAV